MIVVDITDSNLVIGVSSAILSLNITQDTVVADIATGIVVGIKDNRIKVNYE